VRSLSERAQRAGRVRADRGYGVGAVRRASREGASRGELDVGLNGGQANSSTRGLFVFQRPLLNRAIQLAKVVDAGILL